METRYYETGFCKAAEDAGINPDVLVKVALNISSDSISDIIDSIAKGYNNLSPEARYSLMGGLAGGLGTLAFSDGSFSNRLMKSLAMGGLSGLGTYGLISSGLWNKGIDWTRDNISKLKLPKRPSAISRFRHGL